MLYFSETGRLDKMKWINLYGLMFVAVILVPNIVFAVKCNDGFENLWKNKIVEFLEHIGRFSCFLFMIVDIPGTCFGWQSSEMMAVYLAVNAVLAAAYCIIWAVCFRKSGIFRALALSIIPSVMFLFSGLLCRSVLLTAAALIFAPSHIMLSYKNARLQANEA